MSVFINPYTYVPIETKEPERIEKEDEPVLLSGHIDCKLTVHSSTFIPNTTKEFHYLQGIKEGDISIEPEFAKCKERIIQKILRDNKQIRKKDITDSDLRNGFHRYKKELEEEDKEKFLKQLYEHVFLDFYSYDDLSSKGEAIPEKEPAKPRIPGSEIRGMVRNIYEQLTNSCFSVIDEENVLSKRTNTPKSAGLLHKNANGKLELFDAERYMLNVSGRTNFGCTARGPYITGEKVYVKKTPNKYIKQTKRGPKKTFYGVDHISSTSNPGYEEAYVLIGENIGRKHHESVIVKRGTASISLKDEDITRFENVIEEYQKYKSSFKAPHVVYKREYEKFKKGAAGGFFPVFYSDVAGVYYLSPSMITREFFASTISDILEKNNDHQCCDGNQGWCPTCRLFGMVGKAGKKSKAIASRVRFTDSKAFVDPQFTAPRIMPILATTHFSSTEFTLVKPNVAATMWNYDYYKIRNNVHHYVPTLRGRKVYWLGKDRFKDNQYTKACTYVIKKENLVKELKDANVNMRMACRALKGDSKNTTDFQVKNTTDFQVFFEDLTEEELRSLIFCLNLGRAEKTFHRIGRGKPYGMGAVKIEVSDITFREYSFNEASGISAISKSLKDKDNELFLEYTELKETSSFYQENKDIIKKIHTYSKELKEEEGSLVDYPTSLDGNEIFKWFVNNRGTLTREKIEQTLPDLLSATKTLEKNRKPRG